MPHLVCIADFHRPNNCIISCFNLSLSVGLGGFLSYLYFLKVIQVIFVVLNQGICLLNNFFNHRRMWLDQMATKQIVNPYSLHETYSVEILVERKVEQKG